MYEILNERYPDWLDYEPEIIRELDLDEEMTESLFNKIMALQTAFVSQSDGEEFYFTDWRIFENITLSLNGIPPNFGEIEQAEPYELLGVHRLFEELKEVNYNESIINYMVASCKTEGIAAFPFIDRVNDKLEDTELKENTMKKWGGLSDNKIEVARKLSTDSPVNIQIKKLVYADAYADRLVERWI